MKLELKKPFEGLNKAYRKQSLNENQIKLFKDNLQTLFNDCENAEKKKESEEHFKNLASEFLKDTYYKGYHSINTENRKDLAIHNDKTSISHVGVIIEVKHPSNRGEMLSRQNPNAKAMHQMLHYYLQERYLKDNKEIKHLIVTNIYEWYIFDAVDFERFFFDNPKLREDYKKWNTGLLSSSNTNWFYESIAKPFIEKELSQLTATYFNLKEVESLIKKGDKEDDHKLIDLYKILSSEHLLKKPFANDSNTLNKDFYNELLHIIGLEETKDTGKKLIKRKDETARNEGSLLENAINILKVRNKLATIENPTQFGDTEQEQLFSLGLELCITWLNRILFLKLLEGQLVKYHKGDKSYTFLNSDRIKDFDELNELFFEVFAIPLNQRQKNVVDKFGGLPYLNSSLFEESSIETQSLVISDLKDRLEMPISAHTVLKEDNGKRRIGLANTLQYLLAFLDAYNFESDSTAEIQTQNKTIINASVLGLIFEKINGYKDGSFFTPSFITMYMCRETLRKAVVQKFNGAYQWNCETFNDLYNNLDKISLTQANELINSLKVCDPAVGSGHFLVSALNEIIAIKNDLKILVDAQGKRLRGYEISTENDELIILNEDENFVYNYKDAESRRVQETLFHEKQTIIENCLFGVDINPKSVMICRLRLWIELLKNMYYTEKSGYKELETLPNIDINIKCGNSLVSKLNVDDEKNNFSPANRQWIKRILPDYKKHVELYKHVADKPAKKVIAAKIEGYKKGFANLYNPNDKDYIAWKKKENEWAGLQLSTIIDEIYNEKLETEIQVLKEKYEAKFQIYSHAFEWRYEFPEVLDENGTFVGFDVVVGNPPYIVIKGGRYTGYEFSQNEVTFLKSHYLTGEQQINTYTLFVELSNTISKITNSFCSLIIPNTFLANEYSFELRKYILEKFSIEEIYNVGLVFEDANVETAIIIYSKGKKTKQTIINYNNRKYSIDILKLSTYTVDKKFLILLDNKKSEIIGKLNILPKLSNYAKVWRGLTTGNDKKYISIVNTDSQYKPLITGSDIERYSPPKNKKFVLYLAEELDRARDERIFLLQEKLISKFVGTKLTFTYDNNQNYVLNSACITEVINDEYSIKVLLGLLNSNLLDFYFKNVFTDYRETFPIMKSGNIEDLPIPNISHEENIIIDKNVNEILSLKQSNPNADISQQEKALNTLIYTLYGITAEEQAIIEGQTA